MAGLEVVVRPVVFPNIRPQQPKPLPPADDPDSGFCVIKGNGGKQLTLTHTFNINASKSKSTETERRVDEARVYQMDDDGTVSKENFIDVQVANRIKSKGGRFQSSDNYESELHPNPRLLHEESVNYYKRLEEKANIEIKKENVIIKSGESGEE